LLEGTTYSLQNLGIALQATPFRLLLLLLLLSAPPTRPCRIERPAEQQAIFLPLTGPTSMDWIHASR
jgi:hypothetical protein